MVLTTKAWFMVFIPKIPQKVKILENKNKIMFLEFKNTSFIMLTLTVHSRRQRHCSFLRRRRPDCTFPARRWSTSISQPFSSRPQLVAH